MATITHNELQNITTIKIEDGGAYSAFKMFNSNNDPRSLDRHPETRELKDTIINNNKHSQLVVQYGDGYLPLKNR